MSQMSNATQLADAHAGRKARLLQAARDMGPLLDHEADEGERCGALTKPVADALIEAGFFGMAAPRKLGGDELPTLDYLEVIEEVSRLDGATGWVLAVLSSHAGLLGSVLPEAGAHALFAVGIPRVAGMPAPRGKAELAKDGVVFTGKHQFASGSSLATHFWAGGILHVDGRPQTLADGTPRHVAVVVPRDQVREMGNWDVTAMEATASIDYEIGPTFIGDDYVWPVEPWPRENARGAPHWRLGVHTFGPAGHSPVVLGMAHRALQEVARLAPQRKRADLSFPTAADQPTFQHDLALLDAEWHAARAWFREVMEQAEAEVADHGGPLTGVLAAQAKQAARLAHDVAIRCVDFAYVWAGSAALRKGNVIGRVFRNVHAAAQHVVLDRQILVSAGPVVGMRLRSGLERSW